MRNRGRLVPSALLVAVTLACGHSQGRPPTPEHASSSVDADQPAPLDDCNAMRLVALRDADGGITRLLVEVTRDGAPALMIFDTGVTESCLTHVASSGGRLQDGGKIRLFCTDRTLASEPKASLDPPHDGLAIVGNLGADLLQEGPIEIDTRKQTFTLRRNGITGTAGWVRVPFAIQSGIPVTDASVDGTSYRMEIDTGGYRTFLFDANADMSPPVSITQDWTGNEVVMKESMGVLQLGNAAPRRVKLDRSRRYPVFEGWMRSTGIVGNIGVESLGSDRFTFDAQQGELWVEPSARTKLEPASPPPTTVATASPAPRVQRICSGGVPAGSSACTSGPAETTPGGWLTWCTQSGGGSMRCSSLSATPQCASATVSGVVHAACCPAGVTDPTSPGCVTR